jgi:hypothetical protein
VFDRLEQIDQRITIPVDGRDSLIFLGYHNGMRIMTEKCAYSKQDSKASKNCRCRK